MRKPQPGQGLGELLHGHVQGPGQALVSPLRLRGEGGVGGLEVVGGLREARGFHGLRISEGRDVPVPVVMYLGSLPKRKSPSRLQSQLPVGLGGVHGHNRIISEDAHEVPSGRFLLFVAWSRIRPGVLEWLK